MHIFIFLANRLVIHPMQFDIVPPSLQWYMQYLVILDRVITALNCNQIISDQVKCTYLYFLLTAWSFIRCSLAYIPSKLERGIALWLDLFTCRRIGWLCGWQFDSVVKDCSISSALAIHFSRLMSFSQTCTASEILVVRFNMECTALNCSERMGNVNVRWLNVGQYHPTLI